MNRFSFFLAIVIVFLSSATSVDAGHILTDIDSLHVSIIHTGIGPNDLACEKIKAEVNSRLKQVGIDVFTPEPGVMYKLPIWPELKIRVDVLKLEHIQTILAKNIYVEIEPALRQKADVWRTEPLMQAVSVREMPAKVSEVILKQAEVFIGSWRAANPKGAPYVDDNIAVKPAGQIQTPIEQMPIENIYVASKNSDVFHKADCRWAKRIAPKNLVRYKSREEAINDGKRPCKLCKP